MKNIIIQVTIAICIIILAVVVTTSTRTIVNTNDKIIPLTEINCEKMEAMTLQLEKISKDLKIINKRLEMITYCNPETDLKCLSVLLHKLSN